MIKVSLARLKGVNSTKDESWESDNEESRRTFKSSEDNYTRVSIQQRA